MSRSARCSTIAGSTEFAELFLDEVRVPVANRVGDENDGWRVTMVTLSFERGTAFVGDLLEAFELLSATVAVARRTGAWADPGVRRQAGHLQAELDALWALTKRNVSQAARTGIPGVGGTLFKLAYTETRSKLGEFSLSLLGRAGLAADDVEGTDGLGPFPLGRHGGRLAAGHLADHRRRHLADPAQHRRRAHPRPAQGAARTIPARGCAGRHVTPGPTNERGRRWTSN